MPTTPGITLTVTLEDLTGTAAGSAAYPARLSIALCNYGGQLPRIANTAMVAQVGPMFFDFTGTALSIKLWGNDQVTPAGTFYSIAILDDEGNTLQSGDYQFTGTTTVDLSNATPYNPPQPSTSGTYFQWDDVPAGTIDGTNAVFTLLHAPAPATSLNLFLNPGRLTEGIAYTLSGNTITYEASYVPQPGDSHICFYTYIG